MTIRAHRPAGRPRPGPSAASRAAARVGLYVHVPFCAVRCGYCDFSTGALERGAVARWLDGIEREAERRAAAADGAAFTSVFFGGGTPSALAPRDFTRVWRALASRFAIARDAEITLESNPESATDARLAAWRGAGVNRLSFGAQSFDPDELRALGRAHGPEAPARAVARARAHGFERLSLDLIYGAPGQSDAALARTLERAIALDVEHLSAYCFIPEPGTPLGNATLAGRAATPSAAAQARAHARITATLARAGYGAYETSNFCRAGAEARHNLVYWLRRPYLALGPSAHGFWDGERYANHYALARWAESLEHGALPEASRERPDAAEAALEAVMLSLRLARGLDPADHDAGAWRAIEARFGAALARAVAAGRLERAGGAWRVPARRRFVADDVVAWVVAASERAAVDTRAPASHLSTS